MHHHWACSGTEHPVEETEHVADRSYKPHTSRARPREWCHGLWTRCNGPRGEAHVLWGKARAGGPMGDEGLEKRAAGSTGRT